MISFCCLGGGVFYFFCCLGAGACLFFFAVWAGSVLIFWLSVRVAVCFLLFGRGRVRFFCCLGEGRVYLFAVWAGGIFFLLLGQGTGVHSLTSLPISSLRDPTTKKDQTAKQTHVPRLSAER